MWCAMFVERIGAYGHSLDEDGCLSEEIFMEQVVNGHNTDLFISSEY